jgi:hypothetical protein
MKRTRITGSIAFPGDDSDPESAVAALRQSGFEVIGMPEELRSRYSRLHFPYDSFWEASKDGFDNERSVDMIKDEIDAIVDRFGGLCDECDVAGPDYIPFECWLIGRPIDDISN